jgi:hypothetical protein
MWPERLGRAGDWGGNNVRLGVPRSRREMDKAVHESQGVLGDGGRGRLDLDGCGGVKGSPCRDGDGDGYIAYQSTWGLTDVALDASELMAGD